MNLSVITCRLRCSVFRIIPDSPVILPSDNLDAVARQQDNDQASLDERLGGQTDETPAGTLKSEGRRTDDAEGWAGKEAQTHQQSS